MRLLIAIFFLLSLWAFPMDKSTLAEVCDAMTLGGSFFWLYFLFF